MIRSSAKESTKRKKATVNEPFSSSYYSRALSYLTLTLYASQLMELSSFEFCVSIRST